MPKENKLTFPFGDKLFIGIIKFFDSTKGFGYIASNNYGMKSDNRFNKEEQGFKIDVTSWETPVAEKRMVVFRPSLRGRKAYAEGIREINLETDRELVLDYYEHNNFITFRESEKRYSIGRYGRRSFAGYVDVQRQYNILMKCGICRYQLLNEYTEKFKKDGYFYYLLGKVDRIVNTINGDEAYSKQLRANYTNKELEHAAWKELFSVLSDEQIVELWGKHRSLQMFVPDNILLEHINDVVPSYGCSSEVAAASKENEEAKKLKAIEQMIDSHFPGKSRKEIEQIKRGYANKLSPESCAKLDWCIEEKHIEDIGEMLATLDIDNPTLFFRTIINEYNSLSPEGKEQFRNVHIAQYENKLNAFVESISKLEWYDCMKIQMAKFLTEDNIIAEEKLSSIKQPLKNAIIKDFYDSYIQGDELSYSFYNCPDFHDAYACLFQDEERAKILSEIETKCLTEGSLHSIVTLFRYMKKTLPESVKERFIAQPINDIVSHIDVLAMWEDSGRSLLQSITDKILATGELFFHQSYEGDGFLPAFESPIKMDFARKIISICGKETVEGQFQRLQKEDRTELYIKLQLEVITIDELKQYLLNTEYPNYTSILSTHTGKQAILNIIFESDCSSRIGMDNATLWLERYIGSEPLSYTERIEWQARKTDILNSIVSSSNEYLKVLAWALYFQSGGKMQLLKDVFHLFTTSLQIRVLKRLFCAMSLGRFTASLNHLKQTIGYDEHKPSIAVDIALRYLTNKLNAPDAQMTDSIMLHLIYESQDYSDWFMIKEMFSPCNGRISKCDGNTGDDDAFRNFIGTIKRCNVQGQDVYRLNLSRKQLTIRETPTQYNNKQYDAIKEYITITFPTDRYQRYDSNKYTIYDFDVTEERELRIMAEAYRLKMDDVVYYCHYKVDENDERLCCEGRVSNNLDNGTMKVFLWCRNRSCFHKAPHFHTSSEWEQYTILDFMRILSIHTDYTNRQGNTTRHGQYIIFSTYILSFHEFFEHLKCRHCGNLMKPLNITNFALSSVTEFECTNDTCSHHGKVVYLNRCFNSRCNSIIDSRDSRQCPNNSYICEKCGSCCSNRKYEERYQHLQQNGGYISQRLLDAIYHQIGHLERNERYCSSCGERMTDDSCTCGKRYTINRAVF